MKVYVVRQNIDNADISSVHATLEGAKRAVEQTAPAVREGFIRTWESSYDGFDFVESKGNIYRDVLYEITPFDVNES